jgi:hypothetical protein
MEDDGEILLSYDEAVALLPDGDRIHTFLDGGITLIGADWDRAEILRLLERTERREVTGPAAQSYGHGLAAYREDGTPVFHQDEAVVSGGGLRNRVAIPNGRNIKVTDAMRAVLAAVVDAPEAEPAWGWSICARTGMGSGTVYPALDKADPPPDWRVSQLPDRVEARSIWCVDRAGITYTVFQRRALEAEITRSVSYPKAGDRGFTGAVPAALDRLVTAMLGVTLPTRGRS